MKLLLIAPPTSRNSSQDATCLRMRSFDVLSLVDLMMPEYPHNGGRYGTDHVVNQHVMLEILENRTCVLHPEAPFKLQQQLAVICRFLGKPLLRMEDLPAGPPVNQETIDALNVAGDAAFDIARPVPAPTTTVSHLDELLAEDLPPYTGERLLNNALHAGKSRLQKIRSWMYAQLSGMKNPVVREQQTVRPYVLNTSPLSTTG